MAYLNPYSSYLHNPYLGTASVAESLRRSRLLLGASSLGPYGTLGTLPLSHVPVSLSAQTALRRS
jgi:hypothetical protein